MPLISSFSECIFFGKYCQIFQKYVHIRILTNKANISRAQSGMCIYNTKWMRSNADRMSAFRSMVTRHAANDIFGWCSPFDVKVPWLDLTWSIFFQNRQKWYPISYAKFQSYPQKGSASISEKSSWGTSNPLCLRGLKSLACRCVWDTSLSSLACN